MARPGGYERWILTATMMMEMESLLSRAAAELALRTEVESTLTALLQDVETAHNLGKSLEFHNELHKCRQKLEALQVRYEDRMAAWEADRREKERLGMVLLEQIVKLSAREVEEEKKRKEMELEIQRLEDEQRIAMESFEAQLVLGEQQNQKRETHHDEAANIDKEIGEEILANQTKITKQRMTKLAGQGDVITSTSTLIYSPEANASSSPTGTTPSSKTTAAKDNVLENKAFSSFDPHKLNEATLMKIFAFLDPLDVMSFAQANKALLSKVNIMFGMSSSGEESRGYDSDQQKQEPDCSKEASEDLLKNQPTQLSILNPTPTIVPLPPKPPTIFQTVSTSLPPTASSSSTGTRSSPKLFGIQGPSSSHHRRQGSSTSVSTAGSGGGNPFTQVFSRFGGTTPGVVSDVAPLALSSGVTPSSSSGAASILPSSSSESGSEIKFNAAMANSMASKLTPAELSIILRMRERLQQCEADANRWRLEKEDAVANLDSVKAVKEFLVTRLRDTEKLVSVQKEEIKQIEKNHMEDQEVIVYLDERVKDLERRIEEVKMSGETTKEESMQLVQKHEKKVQVLSDMLQFEREQSKANENEWKIAKKLLVKEVKSCRARLVGLEAEVEGCRQQNAQLKHGLSALQSTASPKKKLVNW
jgi:hypothetical protein